MCLAYIGHYPPLLLSKCYTSPSKNPNVIYDLVNADWSNKTLAKNIQDLAYSYEVNIGCEEGFGRYLTKVIKYKLCS